MPTLDKMSTGDTDVDGSHGDGRQEMSIADAAEHLAVSERTIRRWIKSGTLQAYQVDTPNGPAWRVQVGGLPLHHPRHDARVDTPVKGAMSTVDVQGGQTVKGDEDETSALVTLLEDERRERVALAQRNEQLAGQVGFLQAKLQDAEHKIALLDAPKDEPGEVAERRPWWRFWGR
jgi:excisionase family DNA binding protein